MNARSVEVAAKAAYLEFYGGYAPTDWEDLNQGGRYLWYRIARATIDAYLLYMPEKPRRRDEGHSSP